MSNNGEKYGCTPKRTSRTAIDADPVNHPVNADRWLQIVRTTPLISIDLLVRNLKNQVLLGLRRNQPARGYWFVPGGVVRKGEWLDDAFERVASAELNIQRSRSDSRFRGVYEHLYPQNFADEPGIGTHYIVLAYEILIEKTIPPLPREQHSDWQWFTPGALVQAPAVHENTARYFILDS